MSPSPVATCYVICYDIADDGRRNSLARALGAYGERIQESVFEARLAPEVRERLEADIVRTIDPAEDRLTIYRLCAACVADRRRFGPADGPDPMGEAEVYFV
ncbi:MAG: CRISPR-associated endonuclease Cas2 [bacterium]|nr:CRISPR-associated endonuclease Cas2 [bacterium]